MQVTLGQSITQHLSQLTDQVHVTDNAFNIQNKNINTICILRKIYLYSKDGAPLVGDPGCDIISGFPDDIRSAYLGNYYLSKIYQGVYCIVGAKLKSMIKLGLIEFIKNPVISGLQYKITQKGIDVLAQTTGCYTDAISDNSPETTGVVMIATTVMDCISAECTYVRGFDNDQGNQWYSIAQKVDGMIRNPRLKDPIKSFNFLKFTIDKLLQTNKFLEESEELQLAKSSVEDFLVGKTMETQLEFA